jgi:O-antigen ligase
MVGFLGLVLLVMLLVALLFGTLSLAAKPQRVKRRKR